MCGRYLLTRIEKQILEEFGVEVHITPGRRFNIAPSQLVPVVRTEGEHRILTMQRWGLIPAWAKDPKIGYKLINARSETVLEKPSYREAFKKRRCLILADGFYEWKKLDAKTKQPYCFTMRDNSIFAFAGIWERWKDPKGEVIESCSILTTSPNELCASVHDRMPVILDPRQYDTWLNAPVQESVRLTELLVPFEADRMQSFPVSTAVNSPKNDTAECIKPV